MHSGHIIYIYCEITSGGLSGAFGKVSGVLGDAAAKLTMDTEYQEIRKRRTGGSDSFRRGMEGAAKVREDMVIYVWSSLLMSRSYMYTYILYVLYNLHVSDTSSDRKCMSQVLIHGYRRSRFDLSQ